MSATNRKRTAKPLGAYDTPDTFARACVQRLVDTGHLADVRYVLEAHAGGGSFVDAAYECAPWVSVEAMDLDPWAPGLTPRDKPGHLVTPGRLGDVIDLHPERHPDHEDLLAEGQRRPARGPDPVRAGFLITDPTRPPDAVIGNPPYSVAVPWRKKPVTVADLHVERACAVSRLVVAYVLRLDFLGSLSRVQLYKRFALARVDVLRPRPRFAYGGSDSCEFALFTFDRRHVGPAVQGWIDVPRDG